MEDRRQWNGGSRTKIAGRGTDGGGGTSKDQVTVLNNAAFMRLPKYSAPQCAFRPVQTVITSVISWLQPLARLKSQFSAVLRMISSAEGCDCLAENLSFDGGQCGSFAVFAVYFAVSCSWLELRLRNDLYCVGWGVKLYSLTLSLAGLNRIRREVA